MKNDFSHQEEDGLQEAKHAASLIVGFIQQDLSEKEQDELDEWVGSSDENMKLFEQLTDERNIDKTMDWLKSLDTAIALEKVRSRVKSPVSLFRQYWKYAAAGLVVIISGWLYFTNAGSGKPAFSSASSVVLKDELEPGSSKAVLLAGNGKQIDLSSGLDTVIHLGANIEARNRGSLLSYPSAVNSNQPIVFNTLKTPMGGEYRLQLPDGSRVWLNAASSLTFPTVFTGASRTVELSGEAYFEVAKNAGRPFIVKTSMADVQVLGTHFNVKAYTDEKNVQTTLLEGAVRINSVYGSALLHPGEQAISETGKTKVISKDNIEEAVAWKNGLFSFTKDSIQSVMSQIARWYDIDVVYQSRIDHLFTGRIYRNSTAGQVFRLLGISGDVHFKVEGRKVLVMP